MNATTKTETQKILEALTDGGLVRISYGPKTGRRAGLYRKGPFTPFEVSIDLVDQLVAEGKIGRPVNGRTTTTDFQLIYAAR